MDLDAFYNSEFEQHQITLNNTRHQLLDNFSRLIKISANAVREGNKLLFFGNGGSAGDCQHIAAELGLLELYQQIVEKGQNAASGRE